MQKHELLFNLPIQTNPNHALHPPHVLGNKQTNSIFVLLLLYSMNILKLLTRGGERKTLTFLELHVCLPWTRITTSHPLPDGSANLWIRQKKREQWINKSYENHKYSFSFCKIQTWTEKKEIHTIPPAKVKLRQITEGRQGNAITWACFLFYFYFFFILNVVTVNTNL